MPGLCEKRVGDSSSGERECGSEGKGRKERKGKENRKEVTMMKPQDERTGGG